MTETIKATITALIDECRRRWPKADYITVDGPEVKWFKKTGIETYEDWYLYVSANGTLFDANASTPAALLEKVKSLPEAA